MPRRAVGHRRAVTDLTAALVARRAVGMPAKVTIFESMLASFVSASAFARPLIGTYVMQREDTK